MAEDSKIFWIDENINNKENIQYRKELEFLGFSEVKIYDNVFEAFLEIKEVEWQAPYIIINGKLYNEFVKRLKENLKDIYLVPKIIIFTKDKENIEKNQDFKKYNKDQFYNLGGIALTFDEVKNFLQVPNQNKLLIKEDEGPLSFEYIDCLEKLALPLFYKTLIEISSNDKIGDFINIIYNKYSKDSKKLEKLLSPIKNITNIPIEVLSKYYARIYTSDAETNKSFHTILNKDLREDKKEMYLPFIKALYEGVKLKSLPLASSKELYRGCLLLNEEIKKIKDYLNKKKKNLPGSIVFSKAFLSFSKDKNVAEGFIPKGTGKNKSRVLFILEKDDNIDYSLSTHADIEKLSFFVKEKEVLFFPFSSFEIKEINEVNNRYEIKLLYLGKYLKEFEKKENLTEIQKNLPDSEFKKQILQQGLIKEEKIKNINSKTLLKTYKDFKTKIESSNKSYITGELDVKDINNEIRIINSYENYIRCCGYNNPNTKYQNEKEIKENCEITINGKKIDFSYTYEFKEPGNYKINYLFKNNLKNINYIFYNCSNFIKFDFSNFSTEKVTDMGFLFAGCTNLKNINLSNINTKDVINMNHMFYDCNSLINLNLSDFNTTNVTDMSYMFYDCSNLPHLDILSFNTEKVTRMEYMFSGCSSLKSLNLSNFNTKNVNNMNFMFERCKSLTSLNISNFDTRNVDSIEEIFGSCTYLKKGNIITNDNKILNCLNE